MANSTRFVMTTLNMPLKFREALMRDAERRGVTVGTIAREIVARHYKFDGLDIVAKRGGARAGAGRKPKPITAYQKPSLAPVRIGTS